MSQTATGMRVHPDRGAFRELSGSWPLVPVWAELLADVSTPVGLFGALAADRAGVLLESVERSERWGRYSFVAGDPAAMVVVDSEGALRVQDQVRDMPLPEPSPGESALGSLKRMASSLGAPRVPGLPALAGGLVGYLSYEAATLLDGSPHPAPRQASCPPIALQVIDRAVVFDHWRQRLLLVTHVPAGGSDAYRSATDAIEELAERIRTAVPPPPEPAGDSEPSTPLEAVTAVEGRFNMDEDAFRQSVERAKEHILAGDIFQAVISRRLSARAARGGLPVYRRLRVTNPAPYMFFVRMLGTELAGSSPEPLVRVEERRVTTRPIAGTRPRGRDEAEDRRLEEELLADPKERAEHAMLVDLARNDIGKVCSAGTVSPTELMQVERFSRVMHIVSTVEGELAEGMGPLDALAATFPAGTVTGAPKRRAMEIIAEEEPTSRGPYAGAVGYLTFAGDLDFCITIRTAVIAEGEVTIQAGAGVVADSDPERELRETEAKAAALLAAVDGGSP